ncbi:polymer-forming cytoskeletal protein [Photobacterium sp. GJ3]|uniref:DUF6701 domain-containing protein n=1 Tax=Photobacterium sp. GJ3 TaxID=2829502 RepID=UPI001B8BFA58|nr:DUF6701 domain-containing protein [Photobacterium sp. GJ3]QUJ67137.1 polymer-forming cytoskeletal protein [Photobacterium sp. GJ3]
MDLNDIKSASFTVQGENVSPECHSGQPPVNPDVCELFPGPVQTWTGNRNNLFTSDAGTQISNTDNHYVGFSNAIIDTDYPEAYSPTDNVKALCDGVTCALNGRMAQKRTLVWSTAGTTEIVDKVVTGNESAVPGTYFSSSYGDPYFGLTIEPAGHLTFSAGEYWIQSADVRGTMTIEGEVVLHILERINVAGLVNTTSPSDNLTIYAYNNEKDCPRPGFYPDGPPAVNPAFSVDINSSGSFNGRIYSQGPVALSNQTELIGAVTACQLQMSNTARIVGNSRCFNPPDQNYQLIVDPSESMGLLCERQPVEFQVLNHEGSLATSFQGELDVTTNLTQSGQAEWFTQAEEGTGIDASQSQRFAVEDGITRLWLKSEVIETIQVGGQLVADGDPTADGQYSFVPFQLRIQDQALKMIAGKPEATTVSAMSCSTSNSAEVAKDYRGDRTIRLSTAYTLPDSGTEQIELRDKAGNWQTSNAVLTFSEGQATTQLRYSDAGQAQLKLIDPNCTQAGGCSMTGAAQSLDELDLEGWTQLEGTQTVWSRPYTFALCEIHAASRTDHSGTASAGPGFVAAGDAFSVTFKPVIWTDDLAASVQDFSKDGRSDIETTRDAHPDWCSVQTTPNYYSVTGLPAPLQISIPGRPASPLHEEAASGLLSSSQLNTDFASAAQAQQGVVIDDLRWSEVGSLWLQADADYLGMTVDQGVGEIGRFYPHHFTITDSAVEDAYGVFTYMDQPFSFSAKVVAQNAQNAPTMNYGLLSHDYQETLVLQAIDSEAAGVSANDLSGRLSEQESYQSWTKATQEIDQNNLSFLRLIHQETPKVTLPDGPYRVQLGLTVASRDDCAFRGCSDFNEKSMAIRPLNGATPELGAPLTGDIHARYGRMRLEDSAGREGESINIPVMLEYWEAGQFVVNQEDSDSRFDGQQYFRQGITHPQSTAFTASNGEKTVVSGDSQSGDLYATGTAVREQVRFWQKLVADRPVAISGESAIEDSSAGTHTGAVSQPWLLYDWRGQGDENPSAVVTFGLYRGNDRIIYRGRKISIRLLSHNEPTPAGDDAVQCGGQIR